MTLFKRTEGTLDDLDKVLASLEADAGADVVDRKRRLDELTEMAFTLSQNCSKLRKAAEESDPAKRTYGDSMSKKVLELCDRFDALQPKITTVTEAVSAAYAEHEKNMAAQREKEAAAAAAAAKAAQEAAAAKAAAAEREAASRAAAASSAAAPVSDDSATKASAAAAAAAATAAASAAKDEERKKEAAKAAHQAAAPASPSSAPSASTPASASEPAAAGEVTLNLKSNVAGEGTVSITVPSVDITVLQLKEAITKQMGHAPETQRLIFTGRVLDNSSTLSAYNIKSGVSLHLVVSKALGVPRGSPSAAQAGTSESAGSAGSAGPPAGLVHAVNNGGIELRQLLTNAGQKLVVVDWMAPWCGPCRAIAPRIDDLAADHPDVVFLKVDTEASGANKALAMDAGITAFPTFHFYIKATRVNEIKGADITKISQAVVSHKPSLPAVPNPLGEADPKQADALVSKVKAALVKLKAGCASDQEFIAATKTLLSFIGNCCQSSH